MVEDFFVNDDFVGLDREGGDAEPLISMFAPELLFDDLLLHELTRECNAEFFKNNPIALTVTEEAKRERRDTKINKNATTKLKTEKTNEKIIFY